MGSLLALLTVFPVSAQKAPHAGAAHNQSAAASDVPTPPSDAEIGELLSKASEYVDTYKQTFKNAKASLDAATTPGFYESGMTLSEQASSVIAAIRKNGPTAVALVSLLTILDDMSLNAAKASSATMLVAISQDKSNRDNPAMQNFLNLAQAGKNCYDISELLFHATLRLITSEETMLRTLLDNQKRP